MSFHLTAQNIRVEHNHMLVGRLQNTNGEYINASIDLNPFLGNKNGHFEWFGKNFSQTAHDVHFSIEGGGNVPVLRAQLSNLDGKHVSADVNLSEHVKNANGVFEFQ